MTPEKGVISCGVSSLSELDQQCSFLNTAQTLIENFQALNLSATTQDAYAALASMQFRNVQAEKKVADLCLSDERGLRIKFF
jgi:ATPase subunit of ABC transporter with duplicated ATPase domains